MKHIQPADPLKALMHLLTKDGFLTHHKGKYLVDNEDSHWHPLHKSDEEAGGAGVVDLVHYSSRPDLKTLDPKKMGTGPTPSAEDKHGVPEVVRSFFYQKGTQPEHLVTSLNPHKYETQIDNKKHPIYDLVHDEHGIIKQTLKDNHGAWNSDEILGNIKNAGFYGYKHSGSDLPEVIALFHEHPVSYVGTHSDHNHLKKDSFVDGDKKQGSGDKLFFHKYVLPVSAAFMMYHPQMADAHSATSHKNIEHIDYLDTIKMIESSGGKFTDHKPVQGPLHSGASAYGSYGLMPVQIKQTLKLHPHLIRKHPKLHPILDMDHKTHHQEIKNLVHTTNSEHDIASTHWKRLMNKFDNDPAVAAHAWINGVTGTIRTKHEDIGKSPYVKKFKKINAQKRMRRSKQ